MTTALLLATYEMGRQPFGLASPAAWLREAGVTVHCQDLAVDTLDRDAAASADLIGLHLPMHTATRIAGHLLPELRRLNPRAHLVAYGLYAPLNEAWLRQQGVDTVLGAEYEDALQRLAQGMATPEAHAAAPPAADRKPPHLRFRVPDRSGLPAAPRYAEVVLPDGHRRVTGYTEATRGCKHLCRHCPIVPVYGGQFRAVQPDVVLADVRQQVAAGAQHITFGDPDFFNGPTHAERLVRALHAEFPQVTYDVVIKVEHLLRHTRLLPLLRDTGCLFVTTAVEAVDDGILAKLDKGHTQADFEQAVALCREVGLTLVPTFLPFTPWTTLAGYGELLRTLARLELTEAVAPVQLAIRLLIPARSRLLELEEVQGLAQPFDPATLTHPWRHPDPRVDALQERVEAYVAQGQREGLERRALFAGVWALWREAGGDAPVPPELLARRADPATVPYLTEPWYC